MGVEINVDWIQQWMMSENEVFMIHSYKQNYKTNIGRKCEWVEEKERLKKVMAGWRWWYPQKRVRSLKSKTQVMNMVEIRIVRKLWRDIVNEVDVLQI